MKEALVSSTGRQKILLNNNFNNINNIVGVFVDSFEGVMGSGIVEKGRVGCVGAIGGEMKVLGKAERLKKSLILYIHRYKKEATGKMANDFVD
jgi:hypothetical protein